MKSWGFSEELLLQIVTFMKSCEFNEELRLLSKVVTFMKNCDFNEELQFNEKLRLL